MLILKLNMYHKIQDDIFNYGFAVMERNPSLPDFVKCMKDVPDQYHGL